MKRASLSLPEIGAIVGTRGMLAAGMALLFSDRIPKEQRKKIALPLVAIGVVTTIPLAIRLIKSLRSPAVDQPSLF